MAEPTQETVAPAATADTAPSSIKTVSIEGYTFDVDMDLVDDVDNLELIDRIENHGYLIGIIEFLQKIIGTDEYTKLKAYFVAKEGKLKLTKLGDIYQAVFEQFDPKG